MWELRHGATTNRVSNTPASLPSGLIPASTLLQGESTFRGRWKHWSQHLIRAFPLPRVLPQSYKPGLQPRTVVQHHRCRLSNRSLAFLDVAYQGLGVANPDGGATDAWALREFARSGCNMLVCQSFSKNMGHLADQQKSSRMFKTNCDL